MGPVWRPNADEIKGLAGLVWKLVLLKPDVASGLLDTVDNLIAEGRPVSGLLRTKVLAACAS